MKMYGIVWKVLLIILFQPKQFGVLEPQQPRGETVHQRHAAHDEQGIHHMTMQNPR